jgi:micrococcal nuclease
MVGSTVNGIVGEAGKEEAAPDPRVATLLNVVDGDTIRVRFVSGGERRVRYIGIDTPEHGERCFQAATDANRELLGDGRVRLVFDDDREDRYGRLLAYVYRASDGLFINRELLRRGMAEPLTIAPNDEHAREFEALGTLSVRCG